MKKRLPLLLLLLCASVPAQAEIYRWVDEQGQVHYAQTPPRDRSFERLDHRTRGSAATAAPPAAATPDLVTQAEALTREREQRERQRAEAASAEQARRQRCEAARGGLAQLATRPPSRLASRNAAGEYERWTPERHEAERQRLQAVVDEACVLR